MAVCSTTAVRKYLIERSNLGQPVREKAISTTRPHAEGETLITSGAYRRPLFKSSHTEAGPSVFKGLATAGNSFRGIFRGAPKSLRLERSRYLFSRRCNRHRLPPQARRL